MKRWVIITAAAGLMMGMMAFNGLAQEAAPPAEPPATMDMKMSLNDVEDVTDIDATALAEQMEGLEEGDQKEFKVVTDTDLSGVAAGDIYKNNATFFKIKSVKAKGKKGGTFVAIRIRGRMDPSMKWARVSGEGPMVISSRETLLDRFLSGGAVMYPIAALLLLVLIVTIHCGMYFRSSLHCPPEFAEKCRNAIADGDLANFEELAVNQKGLLGHSCRVIVSNIKRLTIDEMKSRVEAEAIHEVGRMHFALRVMNFIAAVAPLLGLLGTVLGMIQCFESLAGETATQSKAMAMAAGIKQALLTTAFGLMVAVPALLSFFIFSYRLTQIANLCAVAAEELLHEVAILRRQFVMGQESGGGEEGGSDGGGGL